MQSPEVNERVYGTLSDGGIVRQVSLSNETGVAVDIISFGGIITRLVAPDAEGQSDDIVLGLDSLAAYQANNAYLGATIGRYANRIAGGRFTIDEIEYSLDCNDGENHLHGGLRGFDRRNWDIEVFATESSAGVVLSLESRDGDQGYPGTLKVRVRYELTSANELGVRFDATTDKSTVVNLTHHSYFNLAGSGDVLGHQLTIPAEKITVVSDGLIPNGELRAVAGTPFDFRKPKPVGLDIDAAGDRQLELAGGYDHNWVVKDSADPSLIMSARLFEPSSGRLLEVWSDAPGIQFYSGNSLDGTLQGRGRRYIRRSGLCLEPQHFPDSPNHGEFPSTRLDPGQDYQSRILYRFLTSN